MQRCNFLIPPNFLSPFLFVPPLPSSILSLLVFGYSYPCQILEEGRDSNGKRQRWTNIYRQEMRESERAHSLNRKNAASTLFSPDAPHLRNEIFCSEEWKNREKKGISLSIVSRDSFCREIIRRSNHLMALTPLE